MNEHQSHYSNFNVMDQKDHWDAHTRKIVEKRVEGETTKGFNCLSREEAHTLFELCSILLDDPRPPVLFFVIHHFDKKLSSDIGEAQRKKGVPKESTLIREGLHLLDEVCTRQHDVKFTEIKNEKTKKQLVNEMMQGTLSLQSGEDSVPTKDFIKKVFSEAVGAYYSHPDVWSEIGYAGPAYPRGYVRSELGHTDPWEAKSDGSQ